MKKKIYGAITLGVCVLLISYNVFAVGTPLKAFFTDFKLFLNGTKVDKEVVVINDSSYLPVRAISEALGLDVNWDGKTETITLTGNSSNNEEKLKNKLDELQKTNDALQKKIDELSKGNQQSSSNTSTVTPSSMATISDSELIKYSESLSNATSLNSAAKPLAKNKFFKIFRKDSSKTFYKVELKEGEGLTAVIKPQIDKSSMAIGLYDSEGSNLDYKYNIDDAEYGIVSYTASQDKTVYVEITGATGVYYVGFYDAYWNNAASKNDERDYFGSMGIAKKICEGTMLKVDSNIKDWYRVELKEGQALTASIVPQIDKSSMAIGLYDLQGSSLDYEYNLDNGETGTVTKKASTDCVYFIEVSGAAGKYKLSYKVN